MTSALYPSLLQGHVTYVGLLLASTVAMYRLTLAARCY
jgi:hypothetical protein